MDYAGAAIPTQTFPWFLFSSTWLMSQGGKQSIRRPLAGVREHQGKILSAKPPRGGDRLLSQGQTPSGALEGDNVWRRVRDCRSHSKDEDEPTGPKGLQESGSAGSKHSHVFKGAPFHFVSCLFGGNLFTWANLSPRLQPFSNSPNVGTTTSRIFSTLGESFILFPFSNYISHFSSPHSLPYKAVPAPYHTP